MVQYTCWGYTHSLHLTVVARAVTCGEGERARPGQFGEEGLVPTYTAGMSTVCTPSLLGPRGFPQRSPLSLKSDKETKKVDDGPSSPPLCPSEFVPSSGSGAPSFPERSACSSALQSLLGSLIKDPGAQASQAFIPWFQARWKVVTHDRRPLATGLGTPARLLRASPGT